MLRQIAPKANRTVRTREDNAIGRSFAEREIMRRFGQPPHSEFDEIANGGEVGIVRRPAR